MMGTFEFIVSVLSLRLFLLSSFVVEGPSMEPTLHSGDMFLTEKVWQQGEHYDRGDIVVFTFADDPDYFYVKRVIGLPDEEVQIRSDGIYINDLRLSEPYLTAGTSSVPRSAAYVDDFRQTYRVPEDAYFVLGDNREQSFDSRYFSRSFIPHDQVMGRSVTEILPSAKRVEWSTAVIHTSGVDVPFIVEVAETDDQRMQGLMYRESLPEGYGMYFIFEEEANRAFWMKNTLIPLDMIFIDAEGKIVHIQHDALPCTTLACPNYPSDYPSQYVLEVGGGETEKWNIDVGDTVTFTR